MDLKQNGDGSMDFWSDQEGKALGRVGGPKSPAGGASATANYRLQSVAAIPMVGVTTTVGITGAIANYVISPNDDIVIDNTQVYIATTSPLCTISIGTATGAGVFGNNLIDGLTTVVGGIYDTQTNKGTSGKTSVYLPAGGYISATPLQGITCSSLAGTIYVTYHKA